MNEDKPSTRAVEPAHQVESGSEVEQSPRPRWRRWLLRWLWIVALLAAIAIGALLLWRKHEKAQESVKPAAAPAVHVVAAAAHKGSIGVYITGLGSVIPINTVTLTSRVDGALMQVFYKEGQMVGGGDLLAQIDPRPYEVALTQAQGALIRDQALLDNARIDLARYETLWAHNAIQEQQLATQRSLVKQDEGNVKSDQGQIDSDQLNLTYCRITSPVAGRVGLRLVDPGNLISANSTAIAVVTQLQPISVIFTIGEDQLPAVRQRFHGGNRLPVAAFDRTMQHRLSQGSLETIDNQIDPTTGTVKLRATFENKDENLFPDQFVNAQMLLQEKRGVTLVPNAAVQRSGTNTYVWIVQPNGTVISRPVNVGTIGPSESEISSGVAPGEIVVTDGVDRLKPGTHVAAQVSETKAGG